MARATTSRGASSASGCSPTMNRSPPASTSTAPAPRSASVSSGIGSRVERMAVGWNWTNSGSAMRAPARIAIARPSPVTSDGLVVWAYSPPMPPVASTTAGARIGSSSPAAVRTETPTTMPPERSRSTAWVSSRTSMSGRASTAERKVRISSAPVASPLAWTMRWREWPASRPSISSPPASRSNRAPLSISHASRSGAAPVTSSATTGSASPEDTASVSTAWRWGSSSAAMAAATPPWAQRLDPSPSAVLVTTTQSPSARAVLSPAIPLPTITARGEVTSTAPPPASVPPPAGRGRRWPARPPPRGACAPGHRGCSPR